MSKKERFYYILTFDSSESDFLPSLLLGLNSLPFRDVRQGFNLPIGAR